MATTISFHKLFGKSPFPPVQEHMRLAAKCVGYLPDLVDAMLTRDDGKVKDLKYKVFDVENQADKVYDELSSEMTNNLEKDGREKSRYKG